MTANPTLSTDELTAAPGSRSRRKAVLLYAGAGLASALAVGLLLVALRIVVGLGGDRGSELVLGLVVLPLVALFCGGVALLAFRGARETLRQRQNRYYPGF